jgi:hypothetical protein
VLICSIFYTEVYRIGYGKNLVISKPFFEDLYTAGGTLSRMPAKTV